MAAPGARAPSLPPSYAAPSVLYRTLVVYKVAIHEAMPSIEIFADLCTFLAYPPHALCLAFLSFRSKVKNVVRGLEAARGSAKAGAAGASNSTAAVTSMVDLGSGDGRYDSHACCATWHICLWPSVCLSFRREGKREREEQEEKESYLKCNARCLVFPFSICLGGAKLCSFFTVHVEVPCFGCAIHSACRSQSIC